MLLPPPSVSVVSEPGLRARQLPARGCGRRLVRLERLVGLLTELRRGCAECRAAVHATRVSVRLGTPGAGRMGRPEQISPSLLRSGVSPQRPRLEYPGPPWVTQRASRRQQSPGAGHSAERGEARPSSSGTGWREVRPWTLEGSGFKSPVYPSPGSQFPGKPYSGVTAAGSPQQSMKTPTGQWERHSKDSHHKCLWV